MTSTRFRSFSVLALVIAHAPLCGDGSDGGDGDDYSWTLTPAP